MDHDLQEALLFLKDRVVGAPPRLIFAKRASAWYIFTDAAHGDGPSLACGWGGSLLHPTVSPSESSTIRLTTTFSVTLTFGLCRAPSTFVKALLP